MRKTLYFTNERAKADAKRLVNLLRSMLLVYDKNYECISDMDGYIDKISREIKDFFVLFHAELPETDIIDDKYTYFVLDNDEYTIIAIREEHIDGKWTRTAEPIDIEQYM